MQIILIINLLKNDSTNDTVHLYNFNDDIVFTQWHHTNIRFEIFQWAF